MSIDHLPYFAVHRISAGRWEVLAPDDDPTRPPWQRAAVMDSAHRPHTARTPAHTGAHHHDFQSAHTPHTALCGAHHHGDAHRGVRGGLRDYQQTISQPRQFGSAS
jgi:hypothetical protein